MLQLKNDILWPLNFHIKTDQIAPLNLPINWATLSKEVAQFFLNLAVKLTFNLVE